jgi:hypothetical protein
VTPDAAAAGQGPLHAAVAFLAARLAAIFPPAKFQHELLPAPLTPALLGKLASHRAPFVGLCLIGLRPAPQAGRQFHATLAFGLYLLTRHPKHRARLLGDSLAPGLAQMIHAAIIGLQGWTVGGLRHAGAGTLELRGVENTGGQEWQDADAACAALTLETEALFTAEEADPLARLASAWTFDGPTDAAADTWERPA